MPNNRKLPMGKRMNSFFSFLCNLLIIRLKQLYRILLLAGIVRIILIVGFFFFLGVAVFIVSKNAEKVWIVTGIWVAIIFFIQSKRNDRNFLQLTIDNTTDSVYFFEYFIISIPLIVCLLINKQFLPILALIAMISFIGFIRTKRTKITLRNQSALQHYIPTYMIEWKAGIRKNFYILLMTWLLGIFFSFFTATVPVAVFLIGLIIIDFYQYNESWQMLVSSEYNEHKFLKYKIIQHIKLFSLFICPLVLLFFIFHYTRWYIIVIELVIMYVIHCFSIIFKYAYYSHDKRVTFNSILMGIGIVLGMIPVTTPLLIIFTVYLYFKAINNIKFYLHDYNQ
jgi:hypothetical protein